MMTGTFSYNVEYNESYSTGTEALDEWKELKDSDSNSTGLEFMLYNTDVSNADLSGYAVLRPIVGVACKEDLDLTAYSVIEYDFGEDAEHPELKRYVFSEFDTRDPMYETYVLNKSSERNNITGAKKVTLPDTVKKVKGTFTTWVDLSDISYGAKFDFNKCDMKQTRERTDETYIYGYRLTTDSSEKGQMIGFGASEALLNNNFREASSLRVDLSRTNIARLPEELFMMCSSIIEVTLPESCSDIGPNCFRGCKNLDSVKMKNVTRYGFAAFAECKNYTDINFGDNTEAIGYSNGYTEFVPSLQGKRSLTAEAMYTDAMDWSNPRFQNYSDFKDCSNAVIACNIFTDVNSQQGYAFSNSGIVKFDVSNTAVSDLSLTNIVNARNLKTVILNGVHLNEQDGSSKLRVPIYMYKQTILDGQKPAYDKEALYPIFAKTTSRSGNGEGNDTDSENHSYGVKWDVPIETLDIRNTNADFYCPYVEETFTTTDGRTYKVLEDNGTANVNTPIWHSNTIKNLYMPDVELPLNWCDRYTESVLSNLTIGNRVTDEDIAKATNNGEKKAAIIDTDREYGLLPIFQSVTKSVTKYGSNETTWVKWETNNSALSEIENVVIKAPNVKVLENNLFRSSSSSSGSPKEKIKTVDLTGMTGLKLIGSNTFRTCNLLEHVYWPEQLDFKVSEEEVEQLLGQKSSIIRSMSYTFCNCDNLDGLNLPENAVFLPDNWLVNSCKNSKPDIVIPDSVIYIGNESVWSTYVNNYVLGKNVEYIASKALGSSLEETEVIGYSVPLGKLRINSLDFSKCIKNIKYYTNLQIFTNLYIKQPIYLPQTTVNYYCTDSNKWTTDQFYVHEYDTTMFQKDKYNGISTDANCYGIIDNCVTPAIYIPNNVERLRSGMIANTATKKIGTYGEASEAKLVIPRAFVKNERPSFNLSPSGEADVQQMITDGYLVERDGYLINDIEVFEFPKNTVAIMPYALYYLDEFASEYSMGKHNGFMNNIKHLQLNDDIKYIGSMSLRRNSNQLKSNMYTTINLKEVADNLEYLGNYAINGFREKEDDGNGIDIEFPNLKGIMPEALFDTSYRKITLGRDTSIARAIYKPIGDSGYKDDDNIYSDVVDTNNENWFSLCYLGDDSTFTDGDYCWNSNVVAGATALKGDNWRNGVPELNYYVFDSNGKETHIDRTYHYRSNLYEVKQDMSAVETLQSGINKYISSKNTAPNGYFEINYGMDNVIMKPLDYKWYGEVTESGLEEVGLTTAWLDDINLDSTVTIPGTIGGKKVVSLKASLFDESWKGNGLGNSVYNEQYYGRFEYNNYYEWVKDIKFEDSATYDLDFSEFKKLYFYADSIDFGGITNITKGLKRTKDTVPSVTNDIDYSNKVYTEGEYCTEELDSKFSGWQKFDENKTTRVFKQTDWDIANSCGTDSLSFDVPDYTVSDVIFSNEGWKHEDYVEYGNNYHRDYIEFLSKEKELVTINGTERVVYILKMLEKSKYYPGFRQTSKSEYSEVYITTDGQKITWEYYKESVNPKGTPSKIIAANLETLGEYGFCFFTNLTDLTLGNLKNIGKYAFDHTPLAKIDTSKLETVAEYAFNGCGNLEYLLIPSSVKRLDDNALSNIKDDDGNSKLKKIVVENNENSGVSISNSVMDGDNVNIHKEIEEIWILDDDMQIRSSIGGSNTKVFGFIDSPTEEEYGSN